MNRINPINVTKNAWKQMTKVIQITGNQYGFLYSASSGGCNGFNFELDLLDKETHQKIINNKFHTVINDKSSKLYVDPISEMYLLGTTIDYISADYKNGVFESKFEFIINKDLMTSCGCGISFSPKNL